MQSARWLMLLAALAATEAGAQQYRWTDEKGNVHYSDSPPASATNVQKKNLSGNTFAAAKPAIPVAALRSYPVTLYTHPQCAHACDMARSLLRKRSIPFNEVSLLDPDAAPEIRARTGGRPIPVLRAGTLVEMNASEAAYNRTLDLAGYPPSPETLIRNQAAAADREEPQRPGKTGR